MVAKEDSLAAAATAAAAAGHLQISTFSEQALLDLGVVGHIQSQVVPSATTRGADPGHRSRHDKEPRRDGGADVFEGLYLEGLNRIDRRAHNQTAKEVKEAFDVERRQRHHAQKLRQQQQQRYLRSHSASRLAECTDSHLGRDANFVQRRQERRRRQAAEEIAECNLAPAVNSSPGSRAANSANASQARRTGDLRPAIQDSKEVFETPAAVSQQPTSARHPGPRSSWWNPPVLAAAPVSPAPERPNSRSEPPVQPPPRHPPVASGVNLASDDEASDGEDNASLPREPSEQILLTSREDEQPEPSSPLSPVAGSPLSPVAEKENERPASPPSPPLRELRPAASSSTACFAARVPAAPQLPPPPSSPPKSAPGTTLATPLLVAAPTVKAPLLSSAATIQMPPSPAVGSAATLSPPIGGVPTATVVSSATAQSPPQKARIVSSSPAVPLPSPPPGAPAIPAASLPSEAALVTPAQAWRPGRGGVAITSVAASPASASRLPSEAPLASPAGQWQGALARSPPSRGATAVGSFTPLRSGSPSGTSAQAQLPTATAVVVSPSRAAGKSPPSRVGLDSQAAVQKSASRLPLVAVPAFPAPPQPQQQQQVHVASVVLSASGHAGVSSPSPPLRAAIASPRCAGGRVVPSTPGSPVPLKESVKEAIKYSPAPLKDRTNSLQDWGNSVPSFPAKVARGAGHRGPFASPNSKLV